MPSQLVFQETDIWFSFMFNVDRPLVSMQDMPNTLENLVKAFAYGF